MGIFSRQSQTTKTAPVVADDPMHVAEEQAILDELVRCVSFSDHPNVSSSVYEFPSYGAKFETKNYDAHPNRAYWYESNGGNVSRNNFLMLADSSKTNVRKLSTALGLIIRDVTGRIKLTQQIEEHLPEASEQILINLHCSNMNFSNIKYEAFPHAEIWKDNTPAGSWQVARKSGSEEYTFACAGNKLSFPDLTHFATSIFAQNNYHAMQEDYIYTPHLCEFLAVSFQNALTSAKGGKVPLLAPSSKPMNDIEKVIAERDQLLIERDELLSERDDLLNELDSYRQLKV